MSKPSYIVFKSYAGQNGDWRIIRQDTYEGPRTKIGDFATRREATQCARLLAGRQGRVAFTTDITTYPWDN